MKNKPYREVNTWKRHKVEVMFINGEGEDEELIDNSNFHELKNLKKLSMHILFDGESVYRTKAGAFGIKEFNYKLLERRGIFFKTVHKKVDVLSWNNEKEYELFIKWVSHFRMSNEIQDYVKIHFMKTYKEEVGSQDIIKPKELKYISLW